MNALRGKGDWDEDQRTENIMCWVAVPHEFLMLLYIITSIPECKALTAFHSGRFAGLCLWQATLRDEVSSLLHEEQAWSLLPIKWWFPKLSVHSSDAVYYGCRYTCCSLGERGTNVKMMFMLIILLWLI